MPKIMLPNYIFRTFDEITPEFLANIGIKALLIDIDNTLAPYEQPLPDERIFNWFEGMKKAGIACALVSNNEAERVELFNKDLGLLAYSKSGKPFPKNLRLAMSILGSDVSSTAMLGDQLLTDATAGNNIGLTTIIVPPINDKNNAFFRAKRWLEVSTIRKYVKIHGGESRKICTFWLDGGYKKKNRK